MPKMPGLKEGYALMEALSKAGAFLMRVREDEPDRFAAPGCLADAQYVARVTYRCLLHQSDAGKTDGLDLAVRIAWSGGIERLQVESLMSPEDFLVRDAAAEAVAELKELDPGDRKVWIEHAY